MDETLTWISTWHEMDFYFYFYFLNVIQMKKLQCKD